MAINAFTCLPYGNLVMQIGAEIFKRALSYPTRLIAKNAGVTGNVVINQVFAC